MNYYLAIDIGASSGRHIVGWLENGVLKTEEIDEAHNFGALKLSSLLPRKARYRLALSATIERFRDEEGTNKLRKYFGKTTFIDYGIRIV